MLTKWGEAVNPDDVLAEYPRPHFRRDSYINLNGIWEYAFTSSPEWPASWQGQILVPFSPEAQLSGVEKTLKPGDFLWYRKRLTLPQNFNRGRIILNFGAVDQVAGIFIDGGFVFEHEGGYTPFSVDITDYINSYTFEIAVRVQDFTDTYYFSRGKQSLESGGQWHTPSSGIWQTVWMESVPSNYVHAVKIIPHAQEGTAEFWVAGRGDCTLRIDGQREHHFPAGRPAVIEIENKELWTPDNPFLYEYRLELGEDKCKGYFALRDFEIKENILGHKVFYLNGEELFVNGIMDQGLWPDGLMTAPSDEALYSDIVTAKAMGFNAIRKHMKIEPFRWYFHCDRLGMLVWQDMPAGGGSFENSRIKYARIFSQRVNDTKYRLFDREDYDSRLIYLNELADVVNAFSVFSCICAWVPFNEGWGQFDSERVDGFIRKFDSARPVERTSGFYDQGGGDMDSRHVFMKKLKYYGSGSRLGILSAFGGYTMRIEGHCFKGKSFGYQRFDSANSLKYTLWTLYREEILPARKSGLAGCFYTQLTDVENELDGLVTYDRKVMKLAPQLVKGIVDPPKKKDSKKGR